MTLTPLLSIVIPVFNGAAQARDTVDAFANQEISDPVEIILVDDGSQPAITCDVDLPSNFSLRLHRLNHNRGRAGASNAGIGASAGKYITFLDVDCIPRAQFLNNLVKHISDGSLLIFGHIHFSFGDAFFDRYENHVQDNRKSALADWMLNLTSANVTLRRDLVLAIDGFSTRYRHYGFEDRDFFIRLHNTYPDLAPIYTEDCTVDHVDSPDLDGILKKFSLSGQHTSVVFAHDHPQEYQQMLLHYFDAQFINLYRFIPKPLLLAASTLLQKVSRGTFNISRRLSWFSLSKVSLKMMKGAAYLRGTLSQDKARG